MDSKRPFDPDSDLRLRPAMEADRSYILALEERCMRAYAEALWGQWRPRPIEGVAVDAIEIIEISGENAGCLGTALTDEHLWIDSLYIEPTFQRRGIGGRLLAHCVAAASAKGLPTRLSVLTTNPALHFYTRHGFSIESETPERRQMVRMLEAPASR